MTEITDQEIAGSVQKGDIHAFGLLVERYQDKLLRYARKFLFRQEDAQDVVQEVFIKAYINIQSYDMSRAFSSWIYRIAHNEFINVIKKNGREPLSFFDPDTVFPHPTAASQADDEIKREELKLMIESCLGQLDPKYREPLVLYYYEDMDYRQIAEVMRVPSSTVGIRLKRGKALLQIAYQKLSNKNE